MIRRDLATAVGVLAVVLGLVLTLVPGPLATVIDGVVDPIVGSWTPEVVLLCLVLAGVLIVAARGVKHQPRAVTPLREPVEHEPRAQVVGDSFEELLERATNPDRPREKRAADRTALETGLRELARESYALATDCDRETAAAAIETGTWCADRRATALLGGPDAPTPRLATWLVDLLRTEHAYRRRVRHAVTAVDRLARDERSGAPSWAEESEPATDTDATGGDPA